MDSLRLWSFPTVDGIKVSSLEGFSQIGMGGFAPPSSALTDYLCVSNATIYESNCHGYLHILSPVPCLVLMRPLRDERTWLPMPGDPGDDKDISYRRQNYQKVLYQFLSFLLDFFGVHSR